jgi:hypothetical protein
MKEQSTFLSKVGIPAADWDQTPTSVRIAIRVLYQQGEELRVEVARLQAQVAKLQEQVDRNSSNSSQPPSSDGPGKQIKTKKRKGRKRGGQKGHKGHRRELLPIEQVNEVVSYKPKRCAECDAELAGEDPAPYRYQVTELPPIKPQVIEHQVHRLTCLCCGKVNRGELPPEVAVSQFGSNLVGLMAVLMGVYRLSKRQVAQLLEDCFEIKLSASSVVRQQKAVSAALADALEEVRTYVQQQPVRNMDETGWPQEDRSKRGWLWVVVTPAVTLFHMTLSRAGQVAKDLIGEDSPGFVGSDRYSAYNWLPVERRQICWAHLLRDFQKIFERDGPSAIIGEPLHLLAEALLLLWGRVRDGTLSIDDFLVRLPAFQHSVHHYLSEGASCSHAKTARTCQHILKTEPALWTFVSQPDLEPTNNSAEQALRKAVIWRKISFGTQSKHGSRFVARILSVVETCRQQGHNPLDYLQLAVTAHRAGLPAPSLLPLSSTVLITP